MQTPDGSVFTGGWVRDVKQGLGRKVYANGDVYEVCNKLLLGLCNRLLKFFKQLAESTPVVTRHAPDVRSSLVRTFAGALEGQTERAGKVSLEQRQRV